MEEFKATIIGIFKGVIFIVLSIFIIWIFTGEKEPEMLDIVGTLAVNAILIHFVHFEKLKKF